MTIENNDLRASTHRTCRYGHGDLEPDRGEDGALRIWGFLNFVPVKPQTEGDQTSPRLTSTQSSYTVQILTCPVCGYVELFDDGTVYG